MKKTLITALIICGNPWPGLAALTVLTPPPPGPNQIGIWYLTSRSCTSNAEVRDGFVPGRDSFQLILTADLKAQQNITLAGCNNTKTGTYSMEGRKLTLNFVETQNCEDLRPVPTHETVVSFLAYLDENESVMVTTGPESQKVCPAGDALVRLFSRIVVQWPRPDPYKYSANHAEK